jgi:hypothetical protein
MSELKTAQMHNLEQGVQPFQGASAPPRASLEELNKLSLEQLVTALLDGGYFAADHELEELLRTKV